ncbi:hypothetical protein SDC9_177767 [bioreactor metagenome]|uniref:Uncharacterized protein n=1 Tax=bioreactor metagenome TaxID=1076179 RepID=A0A645H1U1_9ZZZZ
MAVSSSSGTITSKSFSTGTCFFITGGFGVVMAGSLILWSGYAVTGVSFCPIRSVSSSCSCSFSRALTGFIFFRKAKNRLKRPGLYSFSDSSSFSSSESSGISFCGVNAEVPLINVSCILYIELLRSVTTIIVMNSKISNMTPGHPMLLSSICSIWRPCAPPHFT